MIAQVGLSIDIAVLIEAGLLILISVVCLVLDCIALFATQARTPNTRFATMAGTLSMIAGIICMVWASSFLRQWFPLMLFPISATAFGAVTVAAGAYVRNRIATESSNQK